MNKSTENFRKRTTRKPAYPLEGSAFIVHDHCILIGGVGQGGKILRPRPAQGNNGSFIIAHPLELSSLRVRGCTQQQKKSVARISISITTVPISIPQISVGRPQIDFAAVASIGYIRAVSVTDCWYSPVVVLSSSTSSGPGNGDEK
uniref:Uncharacterized protein n=1 Tax=Anopheles melas TaxID=34690 RepID=A0A182TPZ9_9DIPT